MSSRTNSYWLVDRIHSYLIGTTLHEARMPSTRHPLTADRVWQIWTELVFVAICHQTNWDLLHKKVIEIASSNLDYLKPKSLLAMDIKQFSNLFYGGLDLDRMRTNERLKMLHCLAKESLNWPSYDYIPWLEHYSIELAEKDSLYDWLDKIDVFSQDPLRKKSRIFVHQLLRYGLIDVNDSENIGPAIDYHLIRLYARTGRVLPINGKVSSIMDNGDVARVDSITYLRKAVEEAVWYTSSGGKLRIDQLNHIEWQIARSFCVKEMARCDMTPLTSKPIDMVVQNLYSKAGNKCPMIGKCKGVRNLELRKLVDPQTVRPYY